MLNVLKSILDCSRPARSEIDAFEQTAEYIEQASCLVAFEMLKPILRYVCLRCGDSKICLVCFEQLAQSSEFAVEKRKPRLYNLPFRVDGLENAKGLSQTAKRTCGED